MLKIQVKDTGIGIPEKELSNIFTRFYRINRADELNTGSGIGLHIVKQYVQLHNGEIDVESSLNNGSVFIIYIPADLQPEKNEEYIHIAQGKQNTKNKLLIVEDNKEFLSFLCDQLSEDYTVEAAENGKKAIEKLDEYEPDLIISDVMMPGVNGIEFCKTLKKDIRYSHIPVILLTAQTSAEAEFKGYEAGADAYISKPFNIDILHLRVRNLLEKAEQRKALFKRAIVVQPENITSTSVDEKLIKKAIELVWKNIANSSYSVEQLSKDMNMDRTGLYRKILAISGQTPTAFIRSIRLKRAVQLLEQGLSISQITDLVGFGTTSYFSKCFQEEFGVKPSQYLSKKG